ncbi:thyrotropin-releasing hormone receptor-like [Liolophura sinensis]|uniref:thyrotropin-releasing hormone receptor-like n=1 Tax=Liolophura sinensis TaxID=3198878 RepID=UPI00315819E8
MSSKYMRQFPFSVYLKALAVLDSLVLLHYGMTCADIIKYEDPPFAFRIKGYIACMIYPYLVRVAQLSSAWCVVIFTVDRAVAICDPFFACQNVTISRARTAVAVVVFVLMLSQLYHLILLNLDTDYCHEPFSFPITASEFGAMEVLVLISRIALLLLVPFLTVLCCNLKVIFAVKRSSKIAGLNLQSSIASPKSHNHSRRSDAERKMSIKLFSISITYLLLSLPNAVVILMDLRAITLGDDQWYSQNKNIRFIANMIYSLNFAINYLLYGFAFRKQAVLCMNFKKTSPLTKSMSQRQLPSSKKDSQKTTEAFDY